MRLLDLFCGAGGAAMGYHRAGFDEIVGVDVRFQKNYPFEFIQADAMTFPLEGFDAIHASPPCQGYSIMRNLPWLREKDYPMLIAPVRERLSAHGKSYVIENVENARRHMDAAWLCGLMFGLRIYRHRRFETNWYWMQPAHPRHEWRIRGSGTLGGRARTQVFTARRRPNGTVSTLEHSAGSHRKRSDNDALAGEMGIDWMRPEELTQAIPPAYTEYIGRHLLDVLREGA